MRSRLITTVLVSLVGINTLMQAETARPRLVVGIMVDQLRTDYLDYLQRYFGDKGFRRLMNNGVVLRDVDFRQTVKDPASAAAVVYTGNWPSANGMAGAEVYDPAAKRGVPTLKDTNVSGINTTEGYSPAALRLSTIADEISIDAGGLSSIVSIAADPQQAVVMSGHSGTVAVWIDDATGRWASTSYYKNIPQPLDLRNRYNPLSQRIDTLTWKPSRPISEYPGVPPQNKYYPFRHRYNRSDRDVWRDFKSQAPVNSEVTDAAIDCLKALQMGTKGTSIDMLNLGYTAAPYKGNKNGEGRVELEDTYMRLDAQIGRLLDEIDSSVGLDNTVVFLTSSGYYDDATPVDASFRIPSGDFSLKRAESLLNSYLSARHGNGDYVEAIHDGQVFLDRKAVDAKNLQLDRIRTDAREFLLKMSGVAGAWTLEEVMGGNVPGADHLRLATDAKTCGDIFLTFNPGWNVIDDLTYPVKTYPVRIGQVLTPAIIMAPGIEAATVMTGVDASAIAPTVTSTLHIRSPNGSAHRPLPLK
ncbi:MAG: alkaline phosphatase family protein [Muribaculum sp.]|nr:alkaline phosphatase family protein [Muribaculum sp.]